MRAVPLRLTRGSCAAIAAALAAGCATAVVVPPAPVCKPPEVLTQPCTPLAEIPERSSYGELLKSYQGERKNLAICAERQRDLAKHIVDCGAELARYNERIQTERARAKARQ